MLLNRFWQRFLQMALVTFAIVPAWSANAQQAAAPVPVAPATKSAPPTNVAKAASKAAAKKQADAAAAGKMDPAAASAAVEAGIAALGQGRAEQAAGHLTTAISSGSLPQVQSARALYYRGVAYRRHAKPALAISDLTNALWIKSGLTDEQRADALQQRSAAYREAGLPDQSAPVGQPPAAKAARAGGSASAPFASVAPPPPPAQSSSGGFFSSIFGGGSPPSAAPIPAPPPAPVAAAAPQAKSSVVIPATTASTQVPARTAAATAPPIATATPVQPVVNPDKPATRMVPITPVESSLPMGFQDLPGATREIEVSTTMRPQTPPGVVAKSWDDATQVKTAPTSRSKPVAASTTGGVAAGGAVVAAPPRTGRVQVQVASVRTAEEAQGVAQRLLAVYQRELAGRAPVVEQATAGNVGTIYRVQVGPFATVREAAPLCARLKSEGGDCRFEQQ